MNYPRRFIFHANATGVSAHIRCPEESILEVQGASALPVVGGFSTSKVGAKNLPVPKTVHDDEIKFSDYLRFDSVETTASGDFADKKKAIAISLGKLAPDAVPTTATVTSKVQGFRVADIFEAKLAQIGIISSANPKATEPSIQLKGNKLEGVKVAGFELKVTLDEDLFNKYDTLEKLQAAYEKGLPKERMEMFHRSPNSRSKKLQMSKGLAYATIIRKLEWVNGKPEGLKELGVNAFSLKGFGDVYLGELLISSASRRLTMIRIQFGYPIGGEASAAEGEANGSHWP